MGNKEFFSDRELSIAREFTFHIYSSHNDSYVLFALMQKEPKKSRL